MYNVFSKRILSTLFIHSPPCFINISRWPAGMYAEQWDLKKRNEEMGSMKYKCMETRQESD